MAETIKIYSLDETTSVTMPRCRPTIQLQEESVTRKMASGKYIERVIGMRQTLLASYGYVPAADILALNNIVQEGGFHRVDYPDIGADATGYFKIKPPSYTVFCFRGGTAVWNDVKLSMEGQEVI